MVLRIVTVAFSLLLTACALKSGAPYNDKWSKAKNLTHAAGLDRKIYDQQLPASAYNKEGKLLDYKLGNVSHPAYGSASGTTGVNILPYGPFEDFYRGWTIPGASHHNEHRLFAWMPKEMADSEASAQYKMEKLLARASLTILEEMGYRHKPAKTRFKHAGVAFQQWYIGRPDGNCSLTKRNCLLSIYTPEPVGKAYAPSFSFYSVASEPVWFFEGGSDSRYPRVILAEGTGKESISENIFYQKLSARLPGWIYFYMAPNEVGIGENNQTIAYPYMLEKGKPLLFVRPVK